MLSISRVRIRFRQSHVLSAKPKINGVDSDVWLQIVANYCGLLGGRHNRPHYVHCMSVRLSGCPIRANTSKKVVKNKIGVNVLQWWSNRCTNFSSVGQKSSGNDAHLAWMLATNSHAAVRPLIVGSRWTDGRINVRTRRSDIFACWLYDFVDVNHGKRTAASPFL